MNTNATPPTTTYCNFRYWEEMISSGAMPPEYDAALMDYRGSHGGTVGGMTAFFKSTEALHLDDFPADGYALGALEHDRVPEFLTLQASHAALYLSPLISR